MDKQIEISGFVMLALSKAEAAFIDAVSAPGYAHEEFADPGFVRAARADLRAALAPLARRTDLLARNSGNERALPYLMDAAETIGKALAAEHIATWDARLDAWESGQRTD
jgi:hypothetical protein